MNQRLRHQIKAFKYFGMAIYIILPFISFLIGYQYEQGFTNMADPRTRIFKTRQECENFTDRKCVPTLCEQNPQHASCAVNNQKGWFATRQPLEQGKQPTGIPTESPDALTCMNAGGSWIAEYNECEGIDNTQCTKAGGTFNDCASACRNNPDPQSACIQMCIQVCTF